MQKKKKGMRSLKSRLTLWLALLITGIGALAVILVFVSNRDAAETDMEKHLISIVESNADRLGGKDGELVIKPGFKRCKDGIYSSVYDGNGELVYGDLPADVSEYSPIYRKSREVSINGDEYYIYDCFVQVEQTGTFRVRGLSPVTGRVTSLSITSKLALILLPAAIALAVAVGYAAAGQMLMPLEDVTKAANSIADGADLSQRIKYSGRVKEIDELTDSFNNMFGRLDKSFRRERQFTSDVSHELRTPISVVLAECEYGLENDLTNEDYRRSLETVQRQTKRMSGLISQLLSISRLEQGTQELCFEQVNLGELIYAVCEDQQQITAVKLVPDVEGEVTAKADVTLITRLLVNLIGNACKFGSTRVTVRLKDADGQVSISVEDDGIGIPKSEQEKIWERFYQIDSSRSENGGESCGLGLSMVRQIAQIHGGAVTLESVPGEGSTFTFILPKTE